MNQQDEERDKRTRENTWRGLKRKAVDEVKGILDGFKGSGNDELAEFLIDKDVGTRQRFTIWKEYRCGGALEMGIESTYYGEETK